MMNIENAGDFNRRIKIKSRSITKDAEGYPVYTDTLVIEVWAKVKTTKGFTLIANGSDFEKAYTNFTIRYPVTTAITRDMIIEYKSKIYEIQYLNNVNEADTLLEIQAKEVTH